VKGETELTQLIQMARLGQENAFSLLVKRFEGLVMKVALTMMGTHHDAQDATQDVFLRFFRNIHVMDADLGVAAWFRKTTVRVCLNLLERRKRINFAEQPVSPDQFPTRPQGSFQALKQGLAQLTARERAAFVLVYLFGYSTTETGETLSIAAGTVKSLCFRARGKLREHLEEEGSQ